MLAAPPFSIYLIIFLGMILVIWPFSVQSQAFCLERSAFVAELFREFKETPVAIGISNDKTQIIEVFASPQGETFTIAFTTVKGFTCPIMAGKKWLNVANTLNFTTRIKP
jgi:type IV pilus biogenesis protein CpaD/CtpE